MQMEKLIKKQITLSIFSFVLIGSLIKTIIKAIIKIIKGYRKW